MALNLGGMFQQQQAPVVSQPNQQKTIQTMAQPATGNSNIYSPELDWNTFNQNMLQPYVTSGAWGDPNNQRGAWTSQLGFDPGGRYSVGIKGLDRDSYFRGAMNPNLDDMGLATYQTNPNGQAEWEAAVQKAIADPNSIFTLDTDRINNGGSTQGGNTRSTVEYKLQNGKLVPVSQNNTSNNSWNSNFGEMAALFATAVGGSMLSGAGQGGAAGAGMGGAEGLGGLSGMDLAADAALGTGNNIFTAGQALGGAGGVGAGLGGALNTNATNPALIDSALGTPGYGTSSAGLGGGAGTGLGGLFGDAMNGIKNIPGQVQNSVVGKLLGSVLGGSGGGISGLGNLGSLFTNYQQNKNYGDLIDEIKGIYKPDGEYAKYLEQQLGRRDAAAGRNSQYGPRLAEMMGRLGDSQARALSGLGPMLQGQQGGLNGMVGAGSRLLEGAGGLQGLWNMFTGGGSGGQGGMIPTPTTNGGDYIPNPEYNPVDDNWWTNPQAGP